MLAVCCALHPCQPGDDLGEFLAFPAVDQPPGPAVAAAATGTTPAAASDSNDDRDYDSTDGGLSSTTNIADTAVAATADSSTSDQFRADGDIVVLVEEEIASAGEKEPETTFLQQGRTLFVLGSVFAGRAANVCSGAIGMAHVCTAVVGFRRRKISTRLVRLPIAGAFGVKAVLKKGRRGGWW